MVSDASSNTVTLLVTGGKLIGAFDACIFAPGTRYGALDVDAIRKIDAGECTANEAFQRAGVDYTLPDDNNLRMRTVAMFAAMECACAPALEFPRAGRTRRLACAPYRTGCRIASGAGCGRI